MACRLRRSTVGVGVSPASHGAEFNVSLASQGGVDGWLRNSRELFGNRQILAPDGDLYKVLIQRSAKAIRSAFGDWIEN